MRSAPLDVRAAACGGPELADGEADDIQPAESKELLAQVNKACGM